MKVYVTSGGFNDGGHLKDRPWSAFIACHCGNENEIKFPRDKNIPYRVVVTCTKCDHVEKFAIDWVYLEVGATGPLLESLGYGTD